MNKLLNIVLFLLLSASLNAKTLPRIVYGNDDRQEVANHYDAQLREMALSVAGKVRTYKLYNDPEDDSVYNFKKISLTDWINLCPAEKFREQNTLTSCSGYLIAEDILVTAGHCAIANTDCLTSYWIFDYVEGTERIKKENVFKCKQILEQELITKWFKLKDYAIIQLDRKVQSFRKPLKVRTEGKVKLRTELAIIGHPMGIPMKIADGAKVKPLNIVESLTPIRTLIRKKYYFLANLDSFAGNSGSPVINIYSGEVEGHLIQGARDFKENKDKSCLLTGQRSNSSLFTAEKVYRSTKIKNIKQYIKN